MAGSPLGFSVAVYNQKGGIAKTTTSVNLAVGLAALGRKVLLIDLDAQGNATRSLALPETPSRGIYEIVSGANSLEESIIATPIDNLSVIAATFRLAGIETGLMNELRSQRSVREIFANAERRFDYVVIDCPPAFGLLSVNALVAANAALIPVTASAYAHDGVQRTWDLMRKIQSGLNKELTIFGVLLTMTEDDNLSRHFAQLFRKDYGTDVLTHEVPRDREVVKAAIKRLPVMVFNPDAPSAQAYLGIAGDLARRYDPPDAPVIDVTKATMQLKRWQEAIEPGVDSTSEERPHRSEERAPQLYASRTPARTAGSGVSMILGAAAILVFGVAIGVAFAEPILRLLP